MNTSKRYDIPSERRVRVRSSGRRVPFKNLATGFQRPMTGENLQRVIEGLYGGRWDTYISDVLLRGIDVSIDPEDIKELVESKDIFHQIDEQTANTDNTPLVDRVRQEIRTIRSLYLGSHSERLHINYG